MDTNSNNSLKRFPSDLFVLSGLPILALAILPGLLFNLVPLSPEGDLTTFGEIFNFGAACLILSIPLGFIAHSSTALFSRTIRERIGTHKRLNVLWGTPIRISFRDPKNPLIQSAGPDRVWDTKDDLVGENHP